MLAIDCRWGQRPGATHPVRRRNMRCERMKCRSILVLTIEANPNRLPPTVFGVGQRGRSQWEDHNRRLKPAARHTGRHITLAY